VIEDPQLTGFRGEGTAARRSITDGITMIMRDTRGTLIEIEKVRLGVKLLGKEGLYL